jgi:DNA-binding YbaB/EbfC family protein
LEGARSVARKKKTRLNIPGGGSLKQIQELQTKVLEAQQALAEQTVSTSVGGGAVTVVMTGHHKLQSITISPEVIESEDVEMLQDLIIAAVNEASEKAGEMATQSLAGLTGGLGIPGLT